MQFSHKHVNFIQLWSIPYRDFRKLIKYTVIKKIIGNQIGDDLIQRDRLLEKMLIYPTLIGR